MIVLLRKSSFSMKFLNIYSNSEEDNLFISSNVILSLFNWFNNKYLQKSSSSYWLNRLIIIVSSLDNIGLNSKAPKELLSIVKVLLECFSISSKVTIFLLIISPLSFF